jgi:hypothetical protein
MNLPSSYFSATFWNFLSALITVAMPIMSVKVVLSSTEFFPEKRRLVLGSHGMYSGYYLPIIILIEIICTKRQNV